MRIREIVQQAIAQKYLTVAAEDQLRQLLATKNDCEDLAAFLLLQQAVMNGVVQQQSRESLRQKLEQV
jgi:sulfur relay (sulfurtransferase) DsrF/TusC family protein